MRLSIDGSAESMNIANHLNSVTTLKACKILVIGKKRHQSFNTHAVAYFEEVLLEREADKDSCLI